MLTPYSSLVEAVLAFRRTFVVLPIFLITLLAQVLAPVGAGFAMAAASSDPLNAPICQHVDALPDHGQNPGAPASHDQCCPLCQFVHSGAAPLSPTPTAFAPGAVLPRRVAWVQPDARPTDGRLDANARARAPPSNA